MFALPYLWSWTVIFVVSFLFRYLRVVINIIANLWYRPTPIPMLPTYSAADMTFLLCTTDLDKPVFREVVQSILAHPIHTLLVATAGQKARSQESGFIAACADARVKVLWGTEMSRRKQTANAVRFIETRLMVIQDDHTYLPPHPTFLPSLLAPFEDAKVGAVGPVIKVRHRGLPFFSVAGFWNHIGMTYLQRRAHEFLSTNTIDGGLSCLASRFAVFRTEIYADPEFLAAYLNEYMKWPSVTMSGIKWLQIGPLNGGDDKMVTAWMTKHPNRWRIKIQGGDSTMTTELGHDFHEYYDRCIRWNKTTFRSNPRQLFFERTAWWRFPYTTYATLVYSFFRFTAITEAVLVALCYFALNEVGYDVGFLKAAAMILAWVFTMKLLKVAPIYVAHPWDLVYFPMYIAFTWYCTWIKILAVLKGSDDVWVVAGVSATKTD